MQLSVNLSLAQLSRGSPGETLAAAVGYESAGADIIWVPESYGPDSVSVMATVLAMTDRVRVGSAVLSVFSRSPALLAQTAATLDVLSSGRFILGLGVSGPQVVEGWHGVPFDQPLRRTREVIEICRAVWRGERIEHDGVYSLPLPPGRGVGVGKPLKLISRGHHERIPVFVAALGAKNVEMTAAIADGWLPILFVPEFAGEVWGEALQRGRAQREPALGGLEIVAGGPVAIGDNVLELRDYWRTWTAAHVGGYGTRDQNFYSSLVTKYGYGAQARVIQDLFLSGQKKAAEAAVPDDLLEKTTLIGPAGYVRDRIAAYREAGVTVLNLVPVGEAPLHAIEQVRAML